MTFPRISRFLFFICVLSTAESVFAREWVILSHKSIGKDAVDFSPKGQFSTFADTVLVDGAVTSLPTGAVTYDRTLLSLVDINSIIPISPKFVLRLDLLAQMAMRVEEGAEEPRKISRETWAEGYPKIEGTFFTKNNLEVFLGVTYATVSRYERRTESDSVETVMSYADVSVPIPHIGFTKRTGAFDSGFFYRARGEKSRKIRKFTSQDPTELEFEDKIFFPSMMGLFFQAKFSNYRVFGEFAAVQAGDGGNLTDTGDSVEEDYNVARVMGLFPMGSNDFNLRVYAMHKTLSYADNRNVTLPTIPITATHIQFLRGNETSNTYLGLVYGYGKDGQSLPEFNAKYLVNAYGLSAGLMLSF